MRPVTTHLPVLVRLDVRLRRRSLDLALARGADPWSTPALMLRATRLAAHPHRRRLALDLADMVAAAASGRRLSPFLDVRRREILAQRDVLTELAFRLLDPAPCHVAAIAQLTILIRDASSPMYVGGRPPGRLAAVTARCLELATAELAHTPRNG